MGWLLFGLIGGVILSDLIVRGIYARLILVRFETKPLFQAARAKPNPQAEPIAFSTQDGYVLRGSLHPPTTGAPAGLILFCPELDGSHWTASHYCQGLLAAGFAVLSFDFRNQGESDHQPGYEPLHWPTLHEANDLKAAIAFLKSRPDLATLPWGVMGISRGGQLALWAMTQEPRFQAVCCEGAYDSQELQLFFTLRWGALYLPRWLHRICPLWHYQGTLWLVRTVSEFKRAVRYLSLYSQLARVMRRPVLLIAGDRDNYVHPEVGRALLRRIGSAHNRFWLVPHAKHNLARVIDSEAYDQRIAEFFLTQLKQTRLVDPVGEPCAAA